MTTNVLSLARVLTVAAAIFPAVCDAQDGFPTRPVRFVVPFPAATPPDFLARIASQKLAESWGVPVIVEVRDGAGGTIGVNQVVRAIPDGYTLLFTNDLSIAIAPVLSKTPYDPRKDIGEKERVTVWDCSDHLIHTDRTTSAIAYFHDHRHAPGFRKLLQRDPRQEVRWCPRRERDHEPHRPCRKAVLRIAHRGKNRCGDSKNSRKGKNISSH